MLFHYYRGYSINLQYLRKAIKSFPCYGGYSLLNDLNDLQQTGCFPVMGVILRFLSIRPLSSSCFPVMGVIPNQVLKKWHRMGRFPVIGVIFYSKEV